VLSATSYLSGQTGCTPHAFLGVAFGLAVERLMLPELLLKDRIFRINVITKPGEFSLDAATPDKIAHLMNLGRGEAVKRETLKVVKTRFVGEPKAPPFIPFVKV